MYPSLVLAEQIVNVIRDSGFDRAEAKAALRAAEATIESLSLEELRADRFTESAASTR